MELLKIAVLVSDLTNLRQHHQGVKGEEGLGKSSLIHWKVCFSIPLHRVCFDASTLTLGMTTTTSAAVTSMERLRGTVHDDTTTAAFLVSTIFQPFSLSNLSSKPSSSQLNINEILRYIESYPYLSSIRTTLTPTADKSNRESNEVALSDLSIYDIIHGLINDFNNIHLLLEKGNSDDFTIIQSSFSRSSASTGKHSSNHEYKAASASKRKKENISQSSSSDDAYQVFKRKKSASRGSGELGSAAGRVKGREGRRSNTTKKSKKLPLGIIIESDDEEIIEVNDDIDSANVSNDDDLLTVQSELYEVECILSHSGDFNNSSAMLFKV